MNGCYLQQQKFKRLNSLQELFVEGLIYNSRNSKDLIVAATGQPVAEIYNSRNSKDLIVEARRTRISAHLQQQKFKRLNSRTLHRYKFRHIYNSRNSKDLIVAVFRDVFREIYNSRNSKDLIVKTPKSRKTLNLQQQKFKRLNSPCCCLFDFGNDLQQQKFKRLNSQPLREFRPLRIYNSRNSKDLIVIFFIQIPV